MKLRVRSRLAVVMASLLFVAWTTNTLFYLAYFLRDYRRAVESTVLAVGTTVQAQLDRILNLGITLQELTGFDEQCRKTREEYPDVSGILVVDTGGSVLFADDPARRGQLHPAVATAAEPGPRGRSWEKLPVPSHPPTVGWVVIEYPPDLVGREVGRRYLILNLANLGLIAAVLVGLYVALSRWFLRPLSALEQSVRTLRAQGPTQTGPMVIASRDEIGELGVAFNELLESLRETTVSRDYMDHVVGSIAEVLLVTDPGGLVTLANPKACQITGYPRSEIEGRPLSRLVPEGADGLAREGWGVMARTGHWTNPNASLRTRDGELIPVLLNGSALRDNHEATVGYVFTATDLREHRKEAEEKAMLQAALYRSQKLEAMGTLAGGIAHDFNNILMAVLGYTELMIMGVEESSEMASNLREVRRAGLRARELVEHILTFSRRRDEERRPLQPGPIVKEAVKLLRASLPTTIEMRCTIRPDTGSILADPSSLHRIVMNLCTNAAHAMEDGGTLSVTLDRFQPSQEWRRRHRDAAPGPHVVLSVSDTGCGMPPEVMERIFEPYFTTKAPGKGTGMGLAVVHGIVSGSGGIVTVESTAGRGSRFDVYFPLIEAEVNRPAEARAAAPGGTERVLVVDDEPAIVEMERILLERSGYRVTTRTSSPQALELFRSSPGEFDLVVTDMTMPQLRGDHLAAAMLQIRPGLPIILCTGFSEQITEERARVLGARSLLYKPVLGSDLLVEVRRALDGRDRNRDRA